MLTTGRGFAHGVVALLLLGWSAIKPKRTMHANSR